MHPACAPIAPRLHPDCISKCSESAEVVEPKTRTARRACTPPCTHASLHALTPAGTHPQVVKLKTRKGLAKLALKTGTPIVPAYSVGNTAAYTAVFDRWGVLEALSRKAQASIFLYWGRFGLPIPRRANVTIPATHGALTSPGTQRSVHDSSCCCTVCVLQVTMLIGHPIVVEKVAGEPSAEQIDAVRARRHEAHAHVHVHVHARRCARAHPLTLHTRAWPVRVHRCTRGCSTR